MTGVTNARKQTSGLQPESDYSRSGVYGAAVIGEAVTHTNVERLLTVGLTWRDAFCAGGANRGFARFQGGVETGRGVSQKAREARRMDRSCAVVRAEFAHRCTQVGLDGLLAEAEPCSAPRVSRSQRHHSGRSSPPARPA